MADSCLTPTGARILALEAVLKEITDHFADVMAGPMISGSGIKFENGVEGIPTIAKARALLRSIPPAA